MGSVEESKLDLLKSRKVEEKYVEIDMTFVLSTNCTIEEFNELVEAEIKDEDRKKVLKEEFFARWSSPEMVKAREHLEEEERQTMARTQAWVNQQNEVKKSEHRARERDVNCKGICLIV